MLSSTSTHLINAVSNASQQVLDIGLKPVAVGVDIARAAVTRGDRTRFMSEIPHQVRGTFAGVMPGIRDAGTALRYGLDPNELGKLDSLRAGFGVNPVVDAIAEAPLRMLTASDVLLRSMARGGATAALAARKASREGLNGSAHAARVNEIMSDLTRHLDIVDQADEMAKRSVFQEDSAAADGLLALRRNKVLGPAVELALPFVKTPVNIMAQGLEMSPAGIRNVIQAARKGDAGAAADSVARMAFGTSLLGAGLIAGSNGFLTAGYPEDAKDRTTLPQGWQPWSFRVPTEDGAIYINFGNLGPMGVPLAAAAMATEAKRQGKDVNMPKIAFGVARYLGDQTFMRGLSDFVDAFQQPDRFAERYSEGLATQVAPYGALGRQIQRALGTAQKDPKGALEAWMASYPGLSDRVADRTDSLGDPVRSRQGMATFVSPLRFEPEYNSPVKQAFKEAGIGIGAPPKSITLNGNAAPLTTEEQTMYQRYMADILNRKVYSGISERRLQDVYNESRTMAHDYLIRKIGESELRGRGRDAVSAGRR